MYKQAIRNLTRSEVNFEAICIEIAQSNPSVFNKAFARVMHIGHPNNFSKYSLAPYDPIPEESEAMMRQYRCLDLDFTPFEEMHNKWGDEIWFREVMTQLFAVGDTGNKIKAIKEYRAHTDFGLKECKEFIESIMDMAGMTHLTPGRNW